ncbi:hypothetical protein CCR75_000009 [Bremia lactucae]|uniref:Uncharacterized protein n=1 Tax=Bremia lactucae TaxID=4779 RepID=A0A976IKQ5_BRELC|nr:hypothetical protein CCR75_000009 [Bremia lactucae]
MERVKKLFEEAAEDNAGEDLFERINIRKPLQFNPAVGFIALSMSFRQVEGIILHAKERT